MNFEVFQQLANDFTLIPVYDVITADLLTPVLAYLKMRKCHNQSFLLESVENDLSLGRYSFIGANPKEIIANKGEKTFSISNGAKNELDGDLFTTLKSFIKQYNQPKIEELPYFTGGLVGFIGYENIGLIENVIRFKNESSFAYDSILGLYHTIIAFDHRKHQIVLIHNVVPSEFNSTEEAYNSAVENIKSLKRILSAPIEHKSDFTCLSTPDNSFDEELFSNAIEKSKQNILEGDIFQIVLSQRFESEYKGDLINIYRALRIINPSPYMYYQEFFNGFTVIGTSPEDLLKVKNGTAQLLPIAGTRRRGKTKEEDIELEAKLLSDPKEIAEHTMLVDLGRNDLGRVCKFGTVKVTDLMQIKRYSHVMHIVSRVEGELEPNKDAIDTFKACFPAGTVSGAPKIKAIQLIDEYEKVGRNLYAGAVGYIDFSGNLDTCIAIRTLFATKEKIYWQSGAGIVADSKPELESLEIKNKAAVMINALKYAEVLDEDFGN